jgi:hypothetical protein
LLGVVEMATQAEKQSPSQKWLEPETANPNDEYGKIPNIPEL